jgi:hypothetical protein
MNHLNQFLIITDLEPDDLIAIHLLIWTRVLVDRKVLFVVDQNSNPGKMVQLLRCFLEGTYLHDAEILEGMSTKDSFPRDYYGYDLDKYRDMVIKNWKQGLLNFLVESTFILMLKPPVELIELMKENLIEKNKHTMAIYGSFNIRSLFGKGYMEQQFYQLFGLFKDVYYYETYMAVGDSSIMNLDNMGNDFFDRLFENKLIAWATESWNRDILEDCCESLQKKLSAEDYTNLRNSGYDTGVLPEDLRDACKLDSKIAGSIVKYGARQFVNADCGMVLALMFNLDSFVIGSLRFVSKRFASFTRETESLNVGSDSSVNECVVVRGICPTSKDDMYKVQIKQIKGLCFL